MSDVAMVIGLFEDVLVRERNARLDGRVLMRVDCVYGVSY